MICMLYILVLQKINNILSLADVANNLFAHDAAHSPLSDARAHASAGYQDNVIINTICIA